MRLTGTFNQSHAGSSHEPAPCLKRTVSSSSGTRAAISITAAARIAVPIPAHMSRRDGSFILHLQIGTALGAVGGILALQEQRQYREVADGASARQSLKQRFDWIAMIKLVRPVECVVPGRRARNPESLVNRRRHVFWRLGVARGMTADLVG